MSDNVATATPSGRPDAAEDPPVPTDAQIAADTRPDRVLELIREFSEKLRELLREARETQEDLSKPESIANVAAVIYGGQSRRALGRARAPVLVSRLEKLRPGVLALARYASGMIENTRLTPIMKLELQLRLAEFESTLAHTEGVVRQIAS